MYGDQSVFHIKLIKYDDCVQNIYEIIIKLTFCRPLSHWNSIKIDIVFDDGLFGSQYINTTQYIKFWTFNGKHTLK